MSVEYPLATTMKGTDYESVTPSLQQEMNLARRACWSNKPNYGPGYCEANESCENSTTTTTTKHNDNVNVNVGASAASASASGATVTAVAAPGTAAAPATAPATAPAADGAGVDDNVNVEDVDNDNDVNDTIDNGNNVTTVLNGATISKNIHNDNNNFNCINIISKNTTATTNVNDLNDNDNDDDNANVNVNVNVKNLTETNNLSANNLIKRHVVKPITNANSTTTATTTRFSTATIPQSITSNATTNSTNTTTTTITTTTSTTTMPTTTATAEMQDTSNRSEFSMFWELAQAQLLRFWLAFVAYCDASVLKPDDPRFADAEIWRKKQQEKRQQQQQQQQQQRENETNSKSREHCASGKDNKNTRPQPPSQPLTNKYKLLKSKKLILLFLVCLFFSCLNRIEGRPNTSNAISGQSTTAAIGSEPGVAAKLTSDGMEANTIPQSVTTEGKLLLPHGRAEEGSRDYDDEEEIHRYPLSQVDFDRVKTPFIIGIWILFASIAKIGFHMTPKLHLMFPESCLLIVVGVVIGVILFFASDVAVSPLTPNTFFFYMLPPIILDAGYFMPNRLFFDNLGTILLMAVIGTIFNIATIGTVLWACGLTGLYGGPEMTPRFLDTFLFASLISAVDPVAVLAVFEEIHVNEILYIVVFGESLLNDAVTVVMYHMMEAYNEIGISNIIAQDIVSGVGSFFVVAIGGTVIGIIWGFLTGLVTRFTDHVRVIEPIFIFVMAYLAYLNAEIFHMSGILAITFCGITMKNYVESNISQKSHTTVKYALKMISSSSETIIFMFLGVATVNNNHVWNTWFVVLTIACCSVFRVIGVIILTALANKFRLHKLSRVDQFVMSYGGLRGAVAFALVLLVDENLVKQKEMFITTTIAVIYFTVFVQGITIKPLVKFLNVKRANKRKPTMNERIHERFMDHLMAGIEDIVGKTGNYNVRDKFKRFDNRFIRPFLIRDLKGAEPKIIETYSKLTMRDAMEVMRRNPSTIGQITGTESMSALFRNYTNNCIGGSPSLTNLDNSCSRNLDMHELDYNPSKKDLTDAKIHHLLAEELKPYRRHRRLSYSRHAVDDRDLSTQVNYKMQMNFRRMFNDRKHHKRSKRGASKQQEGVKQNHVSFHDFQQNGTTKQFSHEENQPKLTEVTVVGANDDWDDGLTFTAKSSPDSDRANNNSLIAHIQNLPGFDTSKARIVHHYAPSQSDSSPENLLTPDVGPTAAEMILPWRRDRSYQSIVAENPIPEEDRHLGRDSDGERRVATPTATESQLPWKRQGDEISDAVQQNEFPAWASNKEYLAYNSPSATFLGGINKPKQPKSVIGLFRRESSCSKGGSSIGGDNIDAVSARGSDPTLAATLSSMVPPAAPSTRLDKRSQSISVASGVVSEGHAGPFPVTASHRRNVRRGSMLELSGDIIPEETYHHGHSKSLCEPAGDEWDSAVPVGAVDRTTSASATSDKLLRSGREPLLPKLTPRAQMKRLGGSKSQVTTALLSTSNSSDYDDDDEEDFDLYDDENIVVTTTTTAPGRGGTAAGGRGASGSGSGSGANPNTTTTTIRLTRNNDESII